jgi:hypothetical protein
MPGRWLDADLAGFHGHARFIRSFGYPGNIDASEHVWLTCDGCTGCRSVHLNGQLLTTEPASAFAFDVTQLLTPRNRLEVLIDGQTDDAGLWGEVALEIRKDAFLADVRIEAGEVSTQLLGLVAGVAPEALELYVLVDGRHVDYRTIQPTPAGAPFRVELPDVTPASQSVRVELIRISSIWYVLELPITHGR